MDQIVAVITARGGSRGVPKKNIKPLGGRPLIAWTIEAARQSESLARVIVSTDDPEIAQVATEWGAEVPFLRPATLAGDTSSHVDVILHALDWLNSTGEFPDGLLTLQPTTPFRTSADIDRAACLAREQSVPGIIGVCKTDVHPTACYAIDASGTLAPYIELGEGRYIRRQEYSAAYVVNGAIYLTDCEIIREARTFEPPDSLPLVMSPERSLDIDTPLDFQWAEFLLSQGILAPERHAA